MPRQARRAAPMKPSAAPTQMKTVPSGRFDLCMKGALEVSGTFMVGIPTPAMLGASVIEKLDTLPVGVVSVLVGVVLVVGGGVVVLEVLEVLEDVEVVEEDSS